MNAVAIGPNGYPLCKNGHERYPDNLTKDNKCKACQSNSKKKWYEANKEKVIKKNLKWAAENPEKIKENSRRCYLKNKNERVIRGNAWSKANREKTSQYSAKYRSKNPEKIKAYGIRYYASNSKKNADKNKKWCQANPEKIRIYAHNRRATIRDAGGKLTAGLSEKLLSLQKNKCRICRAKIGGGHKYHMDHIVPLKKGGLNVDENIQLLCPTCNLKKNAKDPYQYAQELGVLFL